MSRVGEMIYVRPKWKPNENGSIIYPDGGAFFFFIAAPTRSRRPGSRRSPSSSSSSYLFCGRPGVENNDDNINNVIKRTGRRVRVRPRTISCTAAKTRVEVYVFFVMYSAFSPVIAGAYAIECRHRYVRKEQWKSVAARRMSFRPRVIRRWRGLFLAETLHSHPASGVGEKPSALCSRVYPA